MDIKENFYSKLHQLREEHLDEAMDKQALTRKLTNMYLGGNPQVKFRRGEATVTAAGREFTHKIIRKNGEHHIEKTPYVTSDLEEASLYEAKKTKRPLPGVNSPAASAIRKTAGPGLVQHSQPWHLSHAGHDIYTHNDMNDSVRTIRAFKVHQKTGKVSEIKNYKPD